MVLGNLTPALERLVQDLLVVHAGHDRLAQLEIVERCLGDTEPHDSGLRRRHRMKVHERQSLRRIDEVIGQAEDHVHLLRRERCDPGVGVLAVVEVVDLIEVERPGPPVAHLPHDGPFAERVLCHLERAGADGVLRKIGLVVHAEAPMHDGGRVIVEVLRHSQGGLLQVELDGVVIDHLHRRRAMPRGWPSSPSSTMAPKSPRFDEPTAGSSQRLTV